MHKVTIPNPPQGMMYNPDRVVFNNICKALSNTEGYCPCVPKHMRVEENKCPCDEVKIEKKCRCGLFV